ncbi:MAG: anti-sigma factor family protein [Candidatus Limnocylindria bacterium]
MTLIKCKEAVDRLWSYLDRGLEQGRERELEEHLGVCRHCCGELAFAEQVRAKLADTGEAQMPPEARERVEQLLRGLGS